jgi:hypothetical protein
MIMSRENWYGSRVTTSASCPCETLSFPMRWIIRGMTYWSCYSWYEWTPKTCRFFEIFVVFISLPYIFMIIFPKLLLLWTAFFMLAIWFPMLFAPKTFRSIMEKTLKNYDIIRIRAFITMIIWLLFLSVYQKFTHGRMMFFSLFGYISLIKWLVLLRFPMYGYNKYTWFYSTRLGSFLSWLFVLLFSAFTLRVALYKI